MEQHHKELPVMEEVKQNAVDYYASINQKNQLFHQVRSKFNVFGGVSIIFSLFFVLCFYRVGGIGINYFIFTAVKVGLLIAFMKSQKHALKKGTIAYFIGALLLGISSSVTSSYTLHFYNSIGIILLLNLSLVHQFNWNKEWDFLHYLGRMFYLLYLSIESIGAPFSQTFEYMHNLKLFKKDKTRNILIGIGLSLPILWIALALLSSADLLFQAWTVRVLNFTFSSNVIGIAILLILTYIICFSIMVGAIKSSYDTKSPQRKQADSTIAITVMICLSVVYVMFCFIQVKYLFGNGISGLPQEYTFSEYARRGFFELVAITGMNIALILIGTLLFKKSKVLNYIMTFMTLCTYIMIGSATYRMFLYIGAYHLTFLRLFVLLILLMDIFVLGGIIVFIYRRSFPLFGYCVAVVSTCFILFSLGKPDFFIARYHINQNETLQHDDLFFLTKELSFDAAPVVIPVIQSMLDNQSWNGLDSNGDYIMEYGYNYYERVQRRKEEEGLRAFNVSTYLAKRSMDQNPFKK